MKYMSLFLDKRTLIIRPVGGRLIKMLNEVFANIKE